MSASSFSSSSSATKLFVLDTNVILHDSACLGNFSEHDILIPITVLEELDKFKKGNESLNFHAREFLRNIDSISGDRLFQEGMPLGEDKGKLMVAMEPGFHPDLSFPFQLDRPDNLILNSAYTRAQAEQDRQVILVSKDVNLRMKAKSIGLLAQDYRNDHVKDVSALYRGKRLVEDLDVTLIDRLYEEDGFPAEDLTVEPSLLPNETLILRNHKKSGLAVFDAMENRIRRVNKPYAYSISPRNAEQALALNLLLDQDIPLVSITGKAGTGKTLLAIASALHLRSQYRQILVARPVLPLSNNDIGYLPGEIEAKIAPYMQPMYDNLDVITDQSSRGDVKDHQIKAMLEQEKLKVSALAFIRGRSLSNTYFIVDEAQNLTPHEVKTIITRAGEGSKIVLTGDIFQIDHPYLDTQSNGLSVLIEKMQGQRLYGHINLEKGERSELAGLASELL